MGRRVCGHVGRPPGRSCAPGRRPHRRTARPHVGRPACAGRWLAPVRLVKAEAAPTRLKGELAIGRFGAGWHDWRVDGDGTAADHFRLVAGDDVSVRVDRHRLQLDVPCTPQRWTGFAVAAADPAREGSTDAPQRPSTGSAKLAEETHGSSRTRPSSSMTRASSTSDGWLAAASSSSTSPWPRRIASATRTRSCHLRGRATRPVSQLTMVALGTPDRRLIRPGE